jgi:uncharacterized protein (DUF2252 family)
MRDSLTRIVGYNQQFRGRDPAWLHIKLDRLCASPFGFLRGTFHLFVDDWGTLGDDPIGAVQPIVGDLHLENLGAFKAHDGRFVFDVNDFDETGPGTPSLDLCRLATSLVLAGPDGGVAAAAQRIESMVAGWCKGVADLDFRPIDRDTKGIPRCVRELVASAEEASRSHWLETRVDNRRFRRSEKYIPVDDVARRRAVEDAVIEFAKNCPEKPADCPSWPRVFDVAVRIAGTGSLGRYRYAVLLPGKSEKPGRELILELKEAIPSSLTPGESGQAERVLATRRRLQADPPAYLGVTTIDGVSYNVRELQPTETKLDSAQLPADDLDALSGAAGLVVGRLHRRGGALEAAPKKLARRITAFALRYAEIVEEDWANLVKNRAAVEAALI